MRCLQGSRPVHRPFVAAILLLGAGACGPPHDAGAGTPTKSVHGTFRNKRSRLVTGLGAANHRGRDALFVVGEPQLLEAKFAYGLVDKDLEDEDVLIEEELPGGGGRVEVVTVRTTKDGPNDDGGRARFEIPKADALGPGRHVFRFTVIGDGTQAELSIVVVSPEQAVFVSDVDGTLTASEVAEFPASFNGRLPAAHPKASTVFQALAARGLVPIYLTARPEWMTGRTRAFLQANAFPPGIVHTRYDKSGAFGDGAARFKRAALERLAQRVRIAWAFGNMPSDAEAYAPLVPNPQRRILYRQDDATHGARRIDSYAELLGEVAGPWEDPAADAPVTGE